MILSVAVPAPLYRLFDYLPSSYSSENAQQAEKRQAEDLFSEQVDTNFQIHADIKENEPAPEIGMRVEVPFGYRKLVGIVVDIRTQTKDDDFAKLKGIHRTLDTQPTFNKTLVELIRWAARYYCHPIGECFYTALPSLLRKHSDANIEITISQWRRTDKEFTAKSSAKKQKELIAILEENRGSMWAEQIKALGFQSSTIRALEKAAYIEELKLDPLSAKHQQSQIRKNEKQLNEEQDAAYKQIINSNFAFHAFLLEGVTGSGKTEVYIAAAQKALSENKQILVLIPEINLSTQTLKRFQESLDLPIGLIHSGLSKKERTNTWLLAKNGGVKVVIGTRSAIFTPFEDLGLIIIDEEHDSSYKQTDNFKYSARDLAVKRAQLENCTVVLGSATPSLETLKNTKEDKYKHISIRSRAGKGSNPNIHILDVRSRPLENGCARPVLDKIEKELELGNQVIVFHNRRGFSPTLICNACGWLMHCPHCDAKLTVHSNPPRMHCHHCDYKEAIPQTCSSCTHTSLSTLGSGTERIEFGLQQRFQDSKIWRFDRDNIRTDKELNTLLEEVNNGDPGILVGTQMLVKGHDFHNVTLVCVVDADASFFSSDFRAIERSAQQIIQVAGRTGRGDKPGTVIIQTKLPEHPIFDCIVNSDYESISQAELLDRESCELPPYTKMISIRSESKTLQSSFEALENLKSQALLPYHKSEDLLISGPVEASITKKAGIYRSYLHLFFADTRLRQQTLDTINVFLDQNKNHKVRLFVDTDPSEYI